MKLRLEGLAKRAALNSFALQKQTALQAQQILNAANEKFLQELVGILGDLGHEPKKDTEVGWEIDNDGTPVLDFTPQDRSES